MAKTLLNGVNEVLKKVKMIQGDSGTLTTLTDAARQVYIDNAVQAWNEVLDELYALTNNTKPNALTTGTITLVTSQRAYSLDSALNRLFFPLLDSTNGQYIYEYPGGYLELIEDQAIPSNYTSLPQYAAIRPTDGYLYLDTSPDSTYNGRVYTYQYDKELVLSSASDTFPFKDVVFRAMVPAVAEMWNYFQKNGEMDTGIYNYSLARAASYLNQKVNSDSWMPPRRYTNDTDPLNG